MARYWRSLVPVALGAAALGAVCLAGADAQAAKEPAAKAKRQDPVQAQRAIEAATKLLNAGKVDQAVQSLSATLAAGNLPPAVLARALHVRGMAYRQQRKPAQALSDLTSALWLKGGLGSDERAEALKERAAAYADAGLTERGEIAAPAVAEHPPAKKAAGNWLSGVFNSPAASAPPVSRPQETGSVAKAPNAIGGWASKTEVVAPAAVRPPKAEAPPPREEAPPSRAESGFQVQVAAVRTKAEALAVAAKARREHAAVLAASEPQIDRAVLGNMGAFYLVRFGPFASAQQTQAVCASLKGSGLDCMPVTP